MWVSTPVLQNNLIGVQKSESASIERGCRAGIFLPDLWKFGGQETNEKIIEFRGEVEIGLGRFLSFSMCYVKF